MNYKNYVFDKNEIDQIILKNPFGEPGIIATLQDIERKYNYLPKNILEYISEKTNVPLATIYGICTFYEFFSLSPKGKFVIKVCDGTSCHTKKSVHLIQHIRNSLGLSETKHTTDDNLFTLELVSCLGACAISPAITLNDKIYPFVTTSFIDDLIRSVKRKESKNC